MQALIIAADFADFKRGDQITDPALIDATMAGQNAVNVVRVNLPDQPGTAETAPT